METLKVEKEEEFELEEETKVEIKPSLEYEKLLREERDRADSEKARNLVKFGCFNQKQESKLDFASYEKINQNKKFKGLYDLYRDLNTMELVFIAPLVEKGEAQPNKAPYAYDLIVTEYMDEETYNLVCHAAKNNLSNVVSVLYKATFISYFAFALLTLVLFVWNWIDSSFIAAAFAVGAYVSAAILGVPLLFLVAVKYRKYKER